MQVEFDGCYFCFLLQKLCGEDADTWADFDDTVIWLNFCSLYDSAKNVLIDQKVLTEIGIEREVVTGAELSDGFSEGHKSEGGGRTSLRDVQHGTECRATVG
jgi:hypothetical protein